MSIIPSKVTLPEDYPAWNPSRTIKYRFDGQPNEAGQTPAVELSINHWKDSKSYGITINRLTIEPRDGAFEVFTYAYLMEGIRLPSVPAARYSRKRLAEVAEAALASFTDFIPETGPVAEQWALVSSGADYDSASGPKPDGPRTFRREAS